MGSLLENKDDEESQALRSTRTAAGSHIVSLSHNQTALLFPINSTFPCAEGSLV